MNVLGILHIKFSGWYWVVASKPLIWGLAAPPLAPCSAPGKAVEDSRSTWAPMTHLETQTLWLLDLAWLSPGCEYLDSAPMDGRALPVSLPPSVLLPLKYVRNRPWEKAWGSFWLETECYHKLKPLLCFHSMCGALLLPSALILMFTWSLLQI